VALSMAWILRIRGRPIAVVSPHQIIIDRDIAPVLEPCLAAYKIIVELGADAKDEATGLTGFKASSEVKNTAYVVRAIRVCLAFTSGIDAEVEKYEKYYELKPPRKEETLQVQPVKIGKPTKVEIEHVEEHADTHHRDQKK